MCVDCGTGGCMVHVSLWFGSLYWLASNVIRDEGMTCVFTFADIEGSVSLRGDSEL